MKKTKIFDGYNEEELNIAARIIKSGGLVAIPTETVYGLAADGLNNKAIRKIFVAKDRPMDNPLILHISDINDIYRLSSDLSEQNIEILKEIWPGPLTVIVKKSSIIPDEVSAGLDTVAIRVPGNELTRRFIEKCETPLAAPSANLSSKPSPTSVASVYEDMNGRIDAIIDGGNSEIGIESTVLDLTSDIPKILRPGYFTKEKLERYWERVDIDDSIIDKDSTPKSPGQKYKHYAPNTKVLVLIGSDDDFRTEVNKLLKENSNIGIMTFDNDKNFFDTYNIIYMGDENNLEYMGSILFDSLRNLDHKNLDLIVVRGVEEKGYGLSIMNRLKKSASENVRRL